MKLIFERADGKWRSDPVDWPEGFTPRPPSPVAAALNNLLDSPKEPVAREVLQAIVEATYDSHPGVMEFMPCAACKLYGIALDALIER